MQVQLIIIQQIYHHRCLNPSGTLIQGPDSNIARKTPFKSVIRVESSNFTHKAALRRGD